MEKVKINLWDMTINQIARIEPKFLWLIFRKKRFENGFMCPQCGSVKVQIIKIDDEGRNYYECSDCTAKDNGIRKKHFNDFTRTIFDEIDLDIKRLLILISLYCYNYNIFDFRFVLKQCDISKNTFYKIKKLFEKIFIFEDDYRKYYQYPTKRKIIVKENLIFKNLRLPDFKFEIDFFNAMKNSSAAHKQHQILTEFIDFCKKNGIEYP